NPKGAPAEFQGTLRLHQPTPPSQLCHALPQPSSPRSSPPPASQPGAPSPRNNCDIRFVPQLYNRVARAVHANVRAHDRPRYHFAHTLSNRSRNAFGFTWSSTPAFPPRQRQTSRCSDLRQLHHLCRPLSLLLLLERSHHRRGDPKPRV